MRVTNRNFVPPNVTTRNSLPPRGDPWTATLNPVELGLRIQVLLKQRGLYQNAIADELGVKHGTMSRMLQGEQNLPYYVVSHYARRLGMSVCELAGEPPHTVSTRMKEAIQVLVEDSGMEPPPLRWLEIVPGETETRRMDVAPLVVQPGQVHESSVPLVHEVDVPAIYEHTQFVLQVNRRWWIHAGIFEGDLLLMRGVEQLKKEHGEAVVFRNNGVEDIRRVERFSVSGIHLHDFAGQVEPVLFEPESIEIIGVIIGRLGGPPRASR